MRDLAFVLAALAVTFVPGVAVMLASGLRQPMFLLATAPPVSVAIAGLVAGAAALSGVSFGITPLGLAVGLLVVLGLGWTRMLRRLRPGRRSARTAHFATGDHVSIFTGTALAAVGCGYAGWTWMRGLGTLSTVPQEHDMIIHAALAAHIYWSGDAAPWQLLPVDVLSGAPVSFYPPGMHLLAGLTADVTGDVVSALNAVTVVFLAVVLGVGTAVLGVTAARQLGLGRGDAALVGGVAALVAAGSYRPAYHLMHDGGVLANAGALALVPGVVAAVLMLPEMRRGRAAAVGVAAAGAVWVHPTAAVSVAVTAVLWFAGQAVIRTGRDDFRASVRPVLVAAAVAALLAAPVLLPASRAAGQTTNWPPDTAPVSLRDAIGNTVSFSYGGYLDPQHARSQVWMVLLLALGAIAVLLTRRGFGVLMAWAGWAAITIGAWTSPGAGFEAPVTGFFYNAMARVWSHVSLLAPVLAGLGVVMTVGAAVGLLRGHFAVRAGWVAPAVVLAVGVGYAAGPAAKYAGANADALASRYRMPDFVRVDDDDRRAIAWLAGRVMPGERVLNSPNDGSDYLYVLGGIPVVNLFTAGVPSVPYTYELLLGFDSYPENQAVRDRLVELDVAWVYVDSEAPTIGSSAAPWIGADEFSLAPGLRDLDGLPGLRPVFRSGSVTVYALDVRTVTEP